MNQIYKNSLYIGLGFLVFILFLGWFFGFPKPLVKEFPIQQFDIQNFDANSNVLRLMTYNIHYGKGIVSDDEAPVSIEDTKYNLDQIVKIIKDNNIDILAVQEIDFSSKRSGFINQLHYIADGVGFKYAAQSVNWDIKYVPHPSLEPSKHYGRVKSGVAVLSKFPITENTRYILEKPESNDFIYNLFYIDRVVQRVVLDLGDKDLILYNLHLEAYDKNTRENQIEALIEIIRLNDSADYKIALGDFNAVPPEAEIKIGFEDEPDNDYNDNVIQMMRDKSRLYDSKSLDSYLIDQQKTFTYPSDVPSRRLDYIFISDAFSVNMEKVLFEPEISDHLPLLLEIKV